MNRLRREYSKIGEIRRLQYFIWPNILLAKLNIPVVKQDFVLQPIRVNQQTRKKTFLIYLSSRLKIECLWCHAKFEQ
jgi:hypothetical protein